MVQLRFNEAEPPLCDRQGLPRAAADAAAASRGKQSLSHAEAPGGTAWRGIVASRTL